MDNASLIRPFVVLDRKVLTMHYWALPNNKSRRLLNNTIVVPGWSSSGYLCLSFRELEGNQKNMLLYVSAVPLRVSIKGSRSQRSNNEINHERADT